MKTLIEVLKLATEYLRKSRDLQARRHAEDLLAHVLKIARLDLYLQFDRPLDEGELESYRALLKRKGKGEPLEYIVGEMLFYHCPILVTPAVLIPRPETEILLDMVCSRLKTVALSGKVAWDVCSGSGCLGIGLKKQFPGLKVTLSDLSHEALALAQKNIEKNGVDVETLQGDLLMPFEGHKADFILCNPPYVSLKEFEKLDLSVASFEPRMALVGGGERGEAFYQRLSQELPSYLNSGAEVFLEIGEAQGELVQDLFTESCWRGKSLKSDWAGRDRFFFLEFQ